MGDGDEAGVGALAHLVEEIAEALDIIVVERRVDLVEHADRRGVGEEDGEDQRERGQRLLAAREQRQRLRFLAGRLGDKFEPGFERIVGFDQLKLGLAALEQGLEQVLKVAVDDFEGGDEPLAALLVEAADGGPEPLDRLGQIIALGDQPVAACLDLGEPRRRRGD